VLRQGLLRHMPVNAAPPVPVAGTGDVAVRLGVPPLDEYLQFLAGRCHPNTVLAEHGAGRTRCWPNTVLAVGYDLKVFFVVAGRTPRSQVAPDSPGEVRLGTVADVQDTVFGHERVILLPVIGHSRGKRRDMPVQALQRQVLLLAQPADPVFDVALEGDDAVAQQRRLLGQERDRAASS
jgi:hypothetical protein